jgi:predicted PolB exonuclease-like 3'-5' exonuclease
MPVKVVAFDIETIYNPDAVALLPEPTPNATLKDPEKIKADIEAKRQKQMAEMGLSANTCLVCCVATFDGKDMNSLLLSDFESETEFLEETWNILGKYNKFVTFNGLEFDVPCLKFRSMVKRVYPKTRFDEFRYRIGNHIDVRMILGGWDRYAKGTQDFYCKLLLGKDEGKPGGMDGSQVQHYWDVGFHDEIQSYCEDDVAKLWRLYEKLIGFYF